MTMRRCIHQEGCEVQVHERSSTPLTTTLSEEEEEEEEESGSGGFGYFLLTPNGVSAPGCGKEVKQVCLAKNSRLLESVEIILTTRHVGGEEEAIDGIYCLARRDLISGME